MSFCEFESGGYDEKSAGVWPIIKNTTTITKVHFGRHDCYDGFCLGVVGLDALESLAGLLAVCANVLNRCGAKSARDGAESFDAGIAKIDTACDEIIKDFATVAF